MICFWSILILRQATNLDSQHQTLYLNSCRSVGCRASAKLTAAAALSCSCRFWKTRNEQEWNDCFATCKPVRLFFWTSICKWRFGETSNLHQRCNLNELVSLACRVCARFHPSWSATQTSFKQALSASKCQKQQLPGKRLLFVTNTQIQHIYMYYHVHVRYIYIYIPAFLQTPWRFQHTV